jgi:hypothetical protein
MSIHTDPSLLDVAGALETLPEVVVEGAGEAAPRAGHA